MIVGDAFVRVRPDGRGFSAEAERSLMGSVGSLAKKAGAVFAAGFIADKAIAGIRESIGMASDLSESMSKVNVVFGDAADSVQRFAANAPDALGQTEAQALEATGTFGNLLRSVGLTEDQSAKFSTTMVGLASDLASFNNTDATEALDALRSGLVGETEPLKRFGINLNEALLKQEAMALGLTDGKGVLDANAKAQAAYALIMRQTTLAQGDFARTSGGLANQQRILAANADQAKAAFGAGLLPVLERLAPIAGDAIRSLVPLATSLGVGLGRAAEGAVAGIGSVRDAIAGLYDAVTGENPMAGLAVELGNVMGWMEDSPQVDVMADAFTGVGDAAGTARDRVMDVSGSIQDLLPTVEELTSLWRDQQDVILPLSAAVAGFVGTLATLHQVSSTLSAVRTAFSLLGPAISSAMAPLLANPVGLVIAGIVALGAAVYVAYRRVEPFRNAVDAMARIIRDQAMAAFETLAGAVERLGPILSGLADRIGPIRDTLAGVGDTIAGFASSAIAGLQPLVDWMQTHLFPVFVAAGDFADALGDRIRNVMQVVSKVLSTAARVVSAVFSAAWKVAGPIVTGVLNGWLIVMRTVARVVQQVLGVAFDALGATVKVVFAGIKAVVETVLGTMRGAFTLFAGLLRGDFGKAWDGLVMIVKAPLDAISKFISTAFDAIVGFVSGVPARLAAIGSALFTGLIDLAVNGLTALLGAVQGGFGLVVDFVTGAPAAIATAAVGLFSSIIDQATKLPGVIAEQLGKIPGQLLGLVSTLATAGGELGKSLLSGIIGGLSGLVDQAGDLVGDMASAVKGIALGIINGLIDGLNNLLPDRIGAIKIAGREVFGGIDLPENPIPRVQLARGGRVRSRPGGVQALLAEGGWDELVLSTDPARRARNAGLLAGTGMADPAMLDRIVSRVERIAAVPRVGQLTLATTGSPQRHALEFLGALDDAEWLGGGE